MSNWQQVRQLIQQQKDIVKTVLHDLAEERPWVRPNPNGADTGDEIIMGALVDTDHIDKLGTPANWVKAAEIARGRRDSRQFLRAVKKAALDGRFWTWTLQGAIWVDTNYLDSTIAYEYSWKDAYHSRAQA